MLAKPYILPRIMINRIEESLKCRLFHRNCKQSSAARVRKLLLKHFLARLKIFWEPCSHVPIHFTALLIAFILTRIN